MRIVVLGAAALVLAGCGSVDHAPGAIKAVQATQNEGFAKAHTWTAVCLDAGSNRVSCEVTATDPDNPSGPYTYVYKVTGTVDGDREIWDKPERA